MSQVMKWFIGVVLAAMVSFFWGFLSWEVMGWHQNRIFGFQNEAEVSQVLARNVRNGHGIYLLPYQAALPKELSQEEKDARRTALQKARADGPFVRATIRPGKETFSMTSSMALSFLRSLLACCFLAALLARLDWAYLSKVGMCAGAGAFAGVAGVVPDWIWFETPGGTVLVMLADLFIEWTLVGLMLAAFVGLPQTAARD